MSVTLCSVMKDEERYVPEWLAYHRALGFDEILIVDNDSGPAGRGQLLALERAGLMRRLRWATQPNAHNQHLAYMLALRAATTDWVCYLDIDEFLVLHEDRDVGGFVARFADDVSLVSLNWRVFGSSGHRRHSPEPSFLRFPWAARADHPINRHLKYFARAAQVIEPYPHSAAMRGGRSVDAAGVEIAIEAHSWGPISHRIAQVNHYVLRSRDEFDAKLRRGRISEAGTGAAAMSADDARGYFEAHDLNDEPDLAAFAMLDAFGAERARIDEALAAGSETQAAGDDDAVAPQPTEKLFSAGPIEVFGAFPDPAGDTLVVTFSHWHPRGASVPIFAGEMLAQRGFNAVHVVSQRSDWFLGRESRAEVAAMLDFVSGMPAVRQAKLRVGYGSSMGAHAALRFRDRLALDRVLAFAPQYCIDAARVPFETRWREEAAECDFGDDPLRPIGEGDDVVLIYDPLLAMDRAHIGLIDPHHYARHYAVPYSGHPPITFFGQTGVLPQLVTHLIHGDPIDQDLALAQSRRRQSAHFWKNVAEQMLMQRRNVASVRRAIERGLALQSENGELKGLRDMVAAMA